MNRFFVVSRTQPEIDLPKYIGMYEFSIVPLSLSTSDRTTYYPKDKATMATELQYLQAADKNRSIEKELSSNIRIISVIND